MSLCWRSILKEGSKIISDQLEAFYVHLGRGGADYRRCSAYSSVPGCVRHTIALHFGRGTLDAPFRDYCVQRRKRTYRAIARDNVWVLSLNRIPYKGVGRSRWLNGIALALVLGATGRWVVREVRSQ